MKRIWIATSFIGAIATLSSAHVMQMSAIDEQLYRLAGDLVGHSAAVAQESRQTLDRINALATAPCSEADLKALRYITYATRFLQDVGRANAGQVVCTALFGKLKAPKALPRSDVVTRRHTSLWAAAKVVPDERLVSDMALDGRAVTYTLDSAFQKFENPPQGSRALLVTSDGSYIYRSFGEAAASLTGLVNKPSSWGRVDGRHLTRCDKHFDICAVVQYSQSPDEQRRQHLMDLALVLLGGLAGTGVGLILQHRIRAGRSLGKQLQRALQRNQFRVAYQPIVRLRDRKMIGVEALARWNDEDGKSVSPDVFVSEIEKLGELRVLTMTVVKRVLLDLAPYLKGDHEFYASINLGVSDLISSDFQAFLIEETRHHDIAPTQIALEITERGSTDMGVLASSVAHMRSLGFKLFIDDFGTGYSGLAYLVNMPVDTVKIDRMFTSAVGTDSLHARMLEKICEMISELNGSILLEGVETDDQAKRLFELYPDANAQGWFFGKPVEGVHHLKPLLSLCPAGPLGKAAKVRTALVA